MVFSNVQNLPYVFSSDPVTVKDRAGDLQHVYHFSDYRGMEFRYEIKLIIEEEL